MLVVRQCGTQLTGAPGVRPTKASANIFWALEERTSWTGAVEQAASTSELMIAGNVEVRGFNATFPLCGAAVTCAKMASWKSSACLPIGQELAEHTGSVSESRHSIDHLANLAAAQAMGGM